MLLLPQTRETFLWVVKEDHAVEWLTFILLVAASAVSFRNAIALRRSDAPSAAVAFHAVFAVGLLVIGMEEIAWGQRWFGFETPEALREINLQREVTLHNIKGLHGWSDLMRLAFGLGGLVGILLWRSPRMRSVAVPPLLWSWFLIISIHAAIDTYNDFVPISRRIDFALQRTSEVIELLIGGAAFLYAGIHARLDL